MSQTDRDLSITTLPKRLSNSQKSKKKSQFNES